MCNVFETAEMRRGMGRRNWKALKPMVKKGPPYGDMLANLASSIHHACVG